MTDEKISKLIKKLIRNTEKKKIEWDKTSSFNEFSVSLGEMIITTSAWIYYETSRVNLVLMNDKGEEMYRIMKVYEEEPSDYDSLYQLYNVAKGSYYNINEEIDNILGMLDD